MRASKPVQVDTSLQSEIEVNRETGFLKMHKAAGPNGRRRNVSTGVNKTPEIGLSRGRNS